MVPFLLFFLLLGWSLYDGDISPKEGGIFATIWVVILLLFVIFKGSIYWFVVPTVLLDIILIVKVFGQDIQIR